MTLALIPNCLACGAGHRSRPASAWFPVTIVLVEASVTLNPANAKACNPDVDNHYQIAISEELPMIGADLGARLEDLRGSLSELLNGHNGISPDMAIRLEKAGWGSAESWRRTQLSYDLRRARRRAGAIKVKRFPSPEAA